MIYLKIVVLMLAVAWFFGAFMAVGMTDDEGWA